MSRYDERLNWLRRYTSSARVTVYNKGAAIVAPPSTHTIHLKNVGREGHTFLYHIVSRYHSLADWTIFTQAEKPSFGYKGHRSGGGHLPAGLTFDAYLVPKPNGSLFIHTAAIALPPMSSLLRMSYTFNKSVFEDDLESCPALDGWSNWWDMGWFKEHVATKARDQGGASSIDYFNDLVRPEGPRVSSIQLAFPQGARFAVSRRVIHRRPLTYYDALLATMNHSHDPYAGYYMEWFWPTVFSSGDAEQHCELPQTTKTPLSHYEEMERFKVAFEKRRKRRDRATITAVPVRERVTVATLRSR